MPQRSRVVYPARTQLPPIPRRRRWLGTLTFFGFVALGALGAYLFFASPLRIARITVIGTKAVQSRIVEEETRALLRRRFARVIPRDNFLLVSSRELEARLGEKLPQFSTIAVAKWLPNELVITVADRMVWGIHCVKPAARAAGCQYLDERGIAFEALGNAAGWLLPVIYGAELRPAGKEAATEDDIGLFETARSLLGGIGGTLRSLAMSTATPSDIRLDLSEGWHLIVPRAQKPEEWVSILKTLLDADVKDRRSELEYVDLRFGNKVFFKYRGANGTSTPRQ